MPGLMPQDRIYVTMAKINIKQDQKCAPSPNPYLNVVLDHEETISIS